ncbi:hypothetical protein PHISCL_10694, partial [Aspergillus sclerotialis]
MTAGSPRAIPEYRDTKLWAMIALKWTKMIIPCLRLSKYQPEDEPVPTVFIVAHKDPEDPSLPDSWLRASRE